MSPKSAHDAVAADVRRSGTSFYWPMRLQRRSYREGLFAIYQFCRVMDDIADGTDSKEAKTSALNEWREIVDSITSGRAISHDQHQTLIIALQDVINRFDLPKTGFMNLIDGMETDVNGPVVAPSLETLLIYCSQVAGAVGDLCLAVWGWRGAEADQFATLTGEALQLTNILRDIKDDADVGRLYLPTEALSAAGIETRDPNDVHHHQNLSDACEYVSNIAAKNFSDAQAVWKTSGVKSARPAWVMLKLYEALFKEVLRTGFGPDRPRARLSGVEKLFHLLRAYATS